MSSHNAQHTGWVVADNISSKAYRIWDSKCVFLGKAKHLRGSNPSIIRVCVAQDIGSKFNPDSISYFVQLCIESWTQCLVP